MRMAGLTPPTCKACGAAAGTVYHRCAACPASASVRDKASGKALEAVERSRSMLTQHDPLYQYGVPVKPARPKRPAKKLKLSDEDERWRFSPKALAEGGDGTFTGFAATDGSLIDRAPAAARRTGWSAVLVDRDGQVMNVVYGRPSCLLATVSL